MKAYRIVTYVIDLESTGLDNLLYRLGNCKYVDLSIGAIQEIDIGEWDDDHPLNHRDTDVEKYFEERVNVPNPH